MAYIVQTTPPPNRVLSFSMQDYSGGLNNNSNQIRDNELYDVLNMMFIDDTIVDRRPGQEYYDETTVTDPLIFIDEFKPYTDPDQMIKATVDSLYIDDVFIVALEGAVDGVNHKGRYFLSDGKKLLVYGKFDQVSSTYRRVIGTPNAGNVIMKVVSPVVGHARLDTTHTQGVRVIDYTLGEVSYEPCENEFIDTNKGANVVPTSVKYIASHDGRIFTSGDERDDDNVFLMDNRNDFYFPVTLPLQLPPNSDKVMGLFVYDGSIIVGRQYDLFVITGNTNNVYSGFEAFNLKRINSHTGLASNRLVNVAHNYLFFFGTDGNAYALTSAQSNVKLLGTTIISKQLNLSASPINVTNEELLAGCSVFSKDLWYVCIGDKMLVYSYRQMAWLMHSVSATSIYDKLGEVVWGRSDGRVAHFGTEYMDFDEPYQAYFHSKLFDMDVANNFKQFREFFVVAHTFEDHNSDINVLFEIDYSDVNDNVVIASNLSIWGKSKWGDRFINRNINESFPIVIGRRGRNIRFKFSNGYFVDGEVETTDDLTTYLGRREGVLVKVLNGGLEVDKEYYLYTQREWKKMEFEDLNQRMRIYQVNGDYELRGKR